MFKNNRQCPSLVMRAWKGTVYPSSHHPLSHPYYLRETSQRKVCSTLPLGPPISRLRVMKIGLGGPALSVRLSWAESPSKEQGHSSVATLFAMELPSRVVPSRSWSQPNPASDSSKVWVIRALDWNNSMSRKICPLMLKGHREVKRGMNTSTVAIAISVAFWA